MAKAKYSRQKNGYFQARVWDGTYQGAKKHYVTIRSKKSSKDLEVKVQQYNDRISPGSFAVLYGTENIGFNVSLNYYF